MFYETVIPFMILLKTPYGPKSPSDVRRVGVAQGFCERGDRMKANWVNPNLVYFGFSLRQKF